VKGLGGRGDVLDAWRALPADLQQRAAMRIAQDQGIAEYFMALVGQAPELTGS
jgi:hypothetical protein